MNPVLVWGRGCVYTGDREETLIEMLECFACFLVQDHLLGTTSSHWNLASSASPLPCIAIW
jgi:hypothetical protein